MAEISFSFLSKLYASAFGYKTQAFNPQFGPVTLPNSNNGKLDPDLNKIKSLKSLNDTGTSKYYGQNPLSPNNEYFMPVTITYPLTTNTGIGNDSFTETKNFELPFPVISASMGKKIISTDLTERNGTFKEMINRQDWDIQIKGLMISSTNDFPEAQFKQMIELCSQDIAVAIKSPLTDMLLIHADRSGSDKVVITSISFPEIQGVQHVRAYDMKLVSDNPFNLDTIK